VYSHRQLDPPEGAAPWAADWLLSDVFLLQAARDWGLPYDLARRLQRPLLARLMEGLRGFTA
jgi:hypothetical protein